jgi:hypothetical protein
MRAHVASVALFGVGVVRRMMFGLGFECNGDVSPIQNGPLKRSG